MNKYRNHIFLTICEVSLDCFEKSVYLSYVNYCRHMNICLKNGDISGKQKNDILKIVAELDLVYSMNDEETNNYILDFFGSNVIHLFEKSVRLTKSLNYI